MQCFGYFPIDLGSGNRTPQLEFRWLNWRTGYCFINFILLVIQQICVTVHTFRLQRNYLNIVYFMFYSSGVVEFMLFFKLTYHWPTFMKEWSKVEVSMRNYEMTTSLRWKLNFIASFYFFLISAEYALVVFADLKENIDNGSNISSAFEAHCLYQFQHILEFVEYSVWIGLVIQRCITWEFLNMFIMLSGTALTYRLRQVSKRIETLSRLKVNNISQWKAVRRDYSRLTELCQAANSRISALIIICLSYNLYSILHTLFYSLQQKDHIIQDIFFFASSGMELIRIAGVCVFGGAVYEEWKNIGSILNYVGTSAYNQEVERMTYQVHSSELSLSGYNFFKISRGLILEMAGAIISYELVLIQFYNNS